MNAIGMIQHGTFFANRNIARAAKVFQRIRLVSRTEDYFVHSRFDLLLAAVLQLQLAEIHDSVAFEAVHELMSHHAVGAQVVAAVHTASNCFKI